MRIVRRNWQLNNSVDVVGLVSNMVSILKHRYAYVALGSNQASSAGSPSVTLKAAICALEDADTRLVAVSRFFRTPAFPAESGPDFINVVAKIATFRPPQALLAQFHRIEAQFERRRETRWGARTVDLDLLAWGGEILPDDATLSHWIDLPAGEQRQKTPEDLILPHPRLQDRAFVLIPFADVDATWCHPLTGKSVSAMIEALPEAQKAEIRPI
jgi:2-amino-4-hydroxy-6-hydroxymethyldihydropteridine diphosphokinase